MRDLITSTTVAFVWGGISVRDDVLNSEVTGLSPSLMGLGVEDIMPVGAMVVVPSLVFIITTPLVVCSTVVPSFVVGAGVENSPHGVVVLVEPSGRMVVEISPVVYVSPFGVMVGGGVDVGAMKVALLLGGGGVDPLGDGGGVIPGDCGCVGEVV